MSLQTKIETDRMILVTSILLPESSYYYLAHTRIVASIRSVLVRLTICSRFALSLIHYNVLMSKDEFICIGNVECTSGDCITPYVWSKTTVNCTMESHGPTSDCRWPSGE